MVFQDPMTSLNPVMKIGKQLTEGLRKHLDSAATKPMPRALELLRSVQIPEPEQRLGEYRHQLSGGMRQRVTIAMALACGPSCCSPTRPRRRSMSPCRRRSSTCCRICKRNETWA